MDGSWDYQLVSEPFPGYPPAGPFLSIQIPNAGFRWPEGYHGAWFRKDVQLPDTLGDDNLYLTVDQNGIFLNIHVYVNGRFAGHGYGGFLPVEFPIGQFIRVGENNRIEIFFADAQSVTEGKGDKSHLIYPVGANHYIRGMIPSMNLTLKPQVRIDEIRVEASALRGVLDIDATIANDSNKLQEVSFEVGVEGIGDFRLSAKADIESHSKENIAVSGKVSSFDRWDLDHPKLYDLEIRLNVEGTEADRKRVTFGFRDFEIKDGHFYLNGRRIQLLGTSDVSHLPLERDEIERRLKMYKSFGGCNTVRLHNHIYPEAWLNVADRLGIMIISESSFHGSMDRYAVNKDVFWDNLADQLRRMIAQYRNHPSVIIWSAGNEVGYQYQRSEIYPIMGKTLDMMRQIDPTRPVMFDGDGDVGGKADIVNIHYPQENDYFHMPDFSLPGNVLFRRLGTRYDGLKPLFIGEFFAMYPGLDQCRKNLDRAAPLGGSDVYISKQKFLEAIALKWSMVIRRYRLLGVDGMSPWTLCWSGNPPNPVWDAGARAFSDVIAIPASCYHNYYGGQKIAEAFAVLNNSSKPLNGILDIWLECEGAELASKAHKINVPAGGRDNVELSLNLPSTLARKEAVLKWRVVQDKKVMFDDKTPISIFPPMEKNLEITKRIYILGDAREYFDHLSNMLWDDTWVEMIKEIPQDTEPAGAIIIAVGKIPQLDWTGWLDKGGNVLFLENWGECPSKDFGLIRDDNHSSTMVFQLARTHPAFKGLKDKDLRFWRNDYYVSKLDYLKPDEGEFDVLAECGGRAGLEWTPLLEKKVGKGTALFCQLNLFRKAYCEPAANVLLRNLLFYLDAVSN
ncbi:MAG: glycoside hydrolase family 2 TIM barrel-domain containing protein [Candidatus Tritonobacter lacicola]|nr:glycoside hydrolase family 2 TIM barrel-domain containing protein [Candidatus Tritonobacter lacicola]